MRIDLSDLKRLEGIGEALGRLFWFLLAVAFIAAILGSAGTGFLVLLLGGTAFAGKAGLEDFVRSRHELKKAAARKRSTAKKRAPTRSATATPRKSPARRSAKQPA